MRTHHPACIDDEGQCVCVCGLADALRDKADRFADLAEIEQTHGQE